jgi:hypothetical protein
MLWYTSSIDQVTLAPNQEYHDLGELCLTSLRPDVRDLIFYLGDFLQVAATFVVGNLCFEFVDLLLVLPESLEDPEEGIGNDYG